MTNTKK